MGVQNLLHVLAQAQLHAPHSHGPLALPAPHLGQHLGPIWVPVITLCRYEQLSDYVDRCSRHSW